MAAGRAGPRRPGARGADIKEKGLVVITGCGHASVVNTLRYVQKLTRRTRLHAVIGGFHLSGLRFEGLIGPTCDGLAGTRAGFPSFPRTAPAGKPHTRWLRKSPKRFFHNSVVTRFEFKSAEPTLQSGTSRLRTFHRAPANPQRRQRQRPTALPSSSRDPISSSLGA